MREGSMKIGGAFRKGKEVVVGEEKVKRPLANSYSSLFVIPVHLGLE